MPAPLSLDLRERVVRAVEAGASIRQAALRFEVSPSAAVKLMRRVRETGGAAPARAGGHRRPLLDGHADLVGALLEAEPDATLAELRAALARHGVVVRAASTISRWLRRAGLTRKKRASGRPSRTARTWPASGAGGGSGSATWTRPPSSSSTRPARPRT
jgi:transposase